MEKKLRELIKQAMIAKKNNNTKENEIRLQTLKNVLENAQKIAKQTNAEVTDTFVFDATKKEMKQANDLLVYCKDNEEKKTEIGMILAICEELLPAMASKEDVTAFVEENKAQFGNIGAMMKALKEHFGDTLNGKEASEIVRTLLK